MNGKERVKQRCEVQLRQLNYIYDSGRFLEQRRVTSSWIMVLLAHLFWNLIKVGSEAERAQRMLSLFKIQTPKSNVLTLPTMKTDRVWDPGMAPQVAVTGRAAPLCSGLFTRQLRASPWSRAPTQWRSPDVLECGSSFPKCQCSQCPGSKWHQRGWLRRDEWRGRLNYLEGRMVNE